MIHVIFVRMKEFIDYRETKIMNVYKWYKVSRILYLHHIPLLPGLIKVGIRILWGGDSLSG